MLKNFRRSLAEAYEIYKTIRDQRVEIERFENSKSLLKNESTFERYIFEKNGKLSSFRSYKYSTLTMCLSKKIL